MAAMEEPGTAALNVIAAHAAPFVEVVGGDVRAVCGWWATSFFDVPGFGDIEKFFDTADLHNNLQAYKVVRRAPSVVPQAVFDAAVRFLTAVPDLFAALLPPLGVEVTGVYATGDGEVPAVLSPHGRIAALMLATHGIGANYPAGNIHTLASLAALGVVALAPAAEDPTLALNAVLNVVNTARSACLNYLRTYLLVRSFPHYPGNAPQSFDALIVADDLDAYCQSLLYTVGTLIAPYDAAYTFAIGNHLSTDGVRGGNYVSGLRTFVELVNHCALVRLGAAPGTCEAVAANLVDVAILERIASMHDYRLNPGPAAPFPPFADMVLRSPAVANLSPPAFSLAVTKPNRRTRACLIFHDRTTGVLRDGGSAAVPPDNTLTGDDDVADWWDDTIISRTDSTILAHRATLIQNE